MFLAAKHFDVVVGIDVHIIMLPTPAGPVPTPVPIPFVGFIFDVMDYVPGMGATVFINGLPRANAGTAAVAMPVHIPMGGPFLKPPGNEGELFMGSSTVLADGEPLGYSGLPVLTCQDIGMPAPFRATKKGVPKSLFLPTSIVMSIPSGPPVLIGGAPTISMMGTALKAVAPLAKRLGATLKKTQRGVKLHRKLKGVKEYLNALADKAFAKLGMSKDGMLRNAVRRSICAVTGHPVDIATGKVFTDFVDVELPGPLPFKIERVWFSTSTYDGPLGHGWHASFDMALAVDEQVIALRLADGRVVLFPGLPDGESHFDARERLTLHREGREYHVVEASSGLVYRFAVRRGRQDMPLATLEDRNGFRVRFEHDERGRLREIVDSGDRSWRLQYAQDSSRVRAIEGPHPEHEDERVIYQQWFYDNRGNLIEARDALDDAQQFKYQSRLLVRETNKRGLSFYFAWDGKNETARCVRTWGDDGIYDHKLTYDPLLNRTTVENSLGFKTQYGHDGAMVRRTTDAFGNTRTTEYGLGYRVTAEVDELGERTEFVYDARGNLTKTSSPDGAEIQLTYDQHDLPARAVDALGGEWTWLRDERGRLLERKDPLERITRYEYSNKWLVAVVNPAGGRTSLHYDEFGNVQTVSTPDRLLTRYGHDRLGRLVAIVNPKGSTQVRDLDLLGRALRVQEPDGNVRMLSYDGEGNAIHAKDAQHDVRFSYCGMNRLASRSEAGTTVRFEYDTEEQLTSIANEHGAVYRFKLGPTGQVDEEHGFDGLMRKYTRDKAGRVLRVDRPGERFSEYEYDPAGRVTAVKHSDGSKESYAYAADGSLTEASNSDATVYFERDALGRIVREEHDGHWVDSEYDLLGMRTRTRSSLGADQRITRNNMGDVLAVGEERSGFEARFTRDQLGLELERSLPGGVRSRWERDDSGRPIQHLVTAGKQSLRAVGYRWDVNDRLRMQIDGHNGPTEYRHDALGNLAWATYPDGSTELRMPDAVGNLFRTEQRGDRKYGPAGQLLVSYTSQGETRYAYDPEGNLIEKTEPSGASWAYAWNGAGMLAKVTRPDGSEVTFGYDALGRRVKKTYRGQTTRWVWDGNVPLHEWVEGKLVSLAEVGGVPFTTADATAKKRDAELEALLAQGPPERGSKKEPITWLFEPESFAPMARLCGGEQQSIVCDHLGTPVLMVDGAGARVWSAAISVYGELRAVDGERWACPFRWPGQYEDAETGLYYNRFRYYDPEAGQYASQDPIGLAGGPAPYAYVRDALTWTDPLGLAACKGGAAEKAAAWQTSSADYPNADRWKDVMLKKGTVIYGGYPGPSPFHTTHRGMSKGRGSRATMFQGLQAKENQDFGYRPSMRAYEVTEDTPAAIALAKANPQHGTGGLPQLFIENYGNVLKPIETIPLPP